MLEHLHKLYLKIGRQPKEDEIKGSGISPHAVANHFGRTSDAIKTMYEKYGIKQKYIKPKNVAAIKRRDYAGDDILHLGIDVQEGPVNEQGVVLLFAKIHKALGFPLIIKLQQGFPDAYAYSIRDSEQRFRANIEFKFRSSSYRNSKKTPEEWQDKADYLICWKHDSNAFEKRVPGIEVIALKDEIAKPEIVEKIKAIFPNN